MLGNGKRKLEVRILNLEFRIQKNLKSGNAPKSYTLFGAFFNENVLLIIIPRNIT